VFPSYRCTVAKLAVVIERDLARTIVPSPTKKAAILVTA